MDDVTANKIIEKAQLRSQLERDILQLYWLEQDVIKFKNRVSKLQSQLDLE